LNNLSSYTVGFKTSEFTEGEIEAGFIGVSLDSQTKVMSLELYRHDEGTSVYTPLGYKIEVSPASEEGAALVEAYIKAGISVSFLAVPDSLISAYKFMNLIQNYTVTSQSYWTKKGETEPLASSSELLGIENATALYTTTSKSYIDKSNYYAEDNTRHCYRGCLTYNEKLYLIEGIPDYVKGVTVWYKNDVTAYKSAETGESINEPDLWKNPNTSLFLSSAELSESNLSKLNLHSLVSEEV
jgi:hypothetical protein